MSRPCVRKMQDTTAPNSNLGQPKLKAQTKDKSFAPYVHITIWHYLGEGS